MFVAPSNPAPSNPATSLPCQRSFFSTQALSMEQDHKIPLEFGASPIQNFSQRNSSISRNTSLQNTEAVFIDDLQTAIELNCGPYIILALLIRAQANRVKSSSIGEQHNPAQLWSPASLEKSDQEWQERKVIWSSIKVSYTPPRSFYKDKHDRMRSSQHFAIAEKWDSKDIKALLGIVEDINKQYTGGDTLLHFAMGQENGSAEVIRLLFQAGASPYLRNNHEQTPLHFISNQCDVETVQLFIKEIRKVRELLVDLHMLDILMPYDKTLKSQDDDTQFMRRFFNHQDYLGNTALHYYLMEPVGTLDTLSALLQAGADPDVVNNAKQSPLQFAIQKQLRSDIILTLQLKGKNPDLNNEAHQSPLHFALKEKKSTPEDIKALLYIVNASKSLDKSVSAINEEEPSEGFTIIIGINEKYRGKTLLDFAFKNGCSEEILQVLIDEGAEVDGTSEHIIEKVPTPPIVERFKGNRIPINYQDAQGNTLFHIALQSGNYRLETIQQFLNLGANPYLPNKAGWSPLQLILEKSASHTIKQLLQDSRVDINHQDKLGNTLLHAALQSGNCRLKTIQKFLGLGADLYLLNAASQSPLQLILETCDPNTIAQLLKDDRVDINHQDKLGNTLLHAVLQAGNCRLKTIQKFLDLGADPYLLNAASQSPLQLILENSDPNIIAQLLKDSRVDINHQDKLGNTLLHAALQSGNCRLKTIQKFLDLGADLYLLNAASQSPLQLILETCDPNTIAQLLKDDRVDINHQDKLGNTLLHTVIQSGHSGLTILQKFLGLGVDPYLANGAGQSPLQLILETCDPNTIAQLLKDDRVDINHQDKLGNTLLHTVIQSGHSGLTILQKFLGLGADPYLANGAGQSAIQRAMQLKCPLDSILALQLQGKTPDQNNEAHQTPLHFALANEKLTSEDVRGLLYTIKDINQKYHGNNTLLQFAIKNTSDIEKIKTLSDAESIDFKFSFKNWFLLRKIIKEKMQDKIQAKTQEDLVKVLSNKMKYRGFFGVFLGINWFITLCIKSAYLPRVFNFIW